MTAAETRRITPRSQGGAAAVNAVNMLGRRAGAWAHRALCRDPVELAVRSVELDDFFPEFAIGKVSPAITAAYARATEVCADCPVAWDCLREHRHELWGVWGGTTPQDRKVLEEPNHGWVRPKAGNPLAISAGGPHRRKAAG